MLCSVSCHPVPAVGFNSFNGDLICLIASFVDPVPDLLALRQINRYWHLKIDQATFLWSGSIHRSRLLPVLFNGSVDDESLESFSLTKPAAAIRCLMVGPKTNIEQIYRIHWPNMRSLEVLVMFAISSPLGDSPLSAVSGPPAYSAWQHFLAIFSDRIMQNIYPSRLGVHRRYADLDEQLRLQRLVRVNELLFEQRPLDPVDANDKYYVEPTISHSFIPANLKQVRLVCCPKVLSNLLRPLYALKFLEVIEFHWNAGLNLAKLNAFHKSIANAQMLNPSTVEEQPLPHLRTFIFTASPSRDMISRVSDLDFLLAFRHSLEDLQINNELLIVRDNRQYGTLFNQFTALRSLRLSAVSLSADSLADSFLARSAMGGRDASAQAHDSGHANIPFNRQTFDSALGFMARLEKLDLSNNQSNFFYSSSLKLSAPLLHQLQAGGPHTKLTELDLSMAEFGLDVSQLILTVLFFSPCLRVLCVDYHLVDSPIACAALCERLVDQLPRLDTLKLVTQWESVMNQIREEVGLDHADVTTRLRLYMESMLGQQANVVAAVAARHRQQDAAILVQFWHAFGSHRLEQGTALEAGEEDAQPRELGVGESVTANALTRRRLLAMDRSGLLADTAAGLELIQTQRIVMQLEMAVREFIGE